MLKKIGLVIVAAAAVFAVGSPAFAATAGSPEHGGWHHGNGQIGLVNTGNIDVLHNVNAVLGACGNDVAVLGAVVPILSPNPTAQCAQGGIVTGNSHN
ncbi:MAG: hypothetical protein ACRDRL_33820 [Sciscionella sp.]